MEFEKFVAETGEKAEVDDGFYSWTEDYPHTCSPIQILGAEFDEDAVRRYRG